MSGASVEEEVRTPPTSQRATRAPEGPRSPGGAALCVRDRNIPRRRSKSTNAILGRRDENRAYGGGAHSPSGGILELIGLGGCLPGVQDENDAARANDGVSREVRITQRKIDEELRRMKEIICGDREALRLQVHEAGSKLRADNALLKGELCKLQACLHESDMENARKDEQIVADADRTAAMQARITSLEQRCAQLAAENAELRGAPSSPIAGVVAVEGRGRGSGGELEKLQRFTVELAEESDVALHAAVENAAVEIITLEKMLREEEGRRRSLQDTLESMNHKMAPIRNKTSRLIDLSSGLSVDCNVMRELLHRGAAIERAEVSEGGALSKSRAAALLLQRHDVISEVMGAQEDIMASSERLVDELQSLFRALENHACGMTDRELVAKVIRQLQSRHDGGDEVSTRFRNVEDMEDFIEAIDILLCCALDAKAGGDAPAPGGDKDAEIATLRMQVEASDLILQSALNAQAHKFEATKGELQSHLVEVEREAEAEIREYERTVVDLKMRIREMGAAERRAEAPAAEPAGPSAAADADGDAEGELVKLRCRLRREKELRRREQRRHSALSVERTRTVAELLTTIRTLKWQADGGRTARVAAASRALRAVRSEIVGLRSTLEEAAAP